MAISLNRLAFSAIFISSMVIAFDRYNMVANGQWDMRTLVVPGVHLVASWSTLINFVQEGCLVSLPILYLIASATIYIAIVTWWKRTEGDSGRIKTGRGQHENNHEEVHLVSH